MFTRIYSYLNFNFWLIVNDHYTPNQQYPNAKHSTFDLVDYIQQLSVSFHKSIVNQTCLIEPQIGWAIHGRTIIAESYAFWTNVRSGWPPLPSLLKSLNPFKKTRTVDKAVSFHYGWNNYYHFFADTLPQIKYWQSLDRKDISWIVPAYIKNIEFVQAYMSQDPIFEGQEIIYQSSEEYIRVLSEAHFIKRSRVGSVELHSIVGQCLSKLTKKTSKVDNKIFLIRKGYRSATNLNELIAIAVSHGFEPIQTDDMSLANQIELFSNTRWLIGFHGAGLTNMIFRKDQKMSVLELFPKNKTPLHYWHLSIDFGFNYTYLIGEDYVSKKSEQYHVDPSQFNQSIQRMLNEDPSLSL